MFFTGVRVDQKLPKKIFQSLQNVYLRFSIGDLPLRLIQQLSATFNRLIDSYINDKVGITENFLDKKLTSHLRENLKALYAQKQLVAAGVGNGSVVIQDAQIRSDKIYWLDRKHNDPFENELFDLIDRFISHLNETCYTGITGYEFHYTLYETGSFYKRHKDQFRNNKGRQFSMIMYLNEDWSENDGGALCIHHEGNSRKIMPLNGNCVLFKSSEMEHEVLITNKPRMSITGWLKTESGS